MTGLQQGNQETIETETQPIPIISQHRRSRSGMEIRFSAQQQPDIMPEIDLFSHSQVNTRGIWGLSVFLDIQTGMQYKKMHVLLKDESLQIK